MVRFWQLLVLATTVAGSYWMEEIAHQGKSPYHPDAGYMVFRNVKDFGAVGDGGMSLEMPQVWGESLNKT